MSNSFLSQGLTSCIADPVSATDQFEEQVFSFLDEVISSTKLRCGLRLRHRPVRGAGVQLPGWSYKLHQACPRRKRAAEWNGLASQPPDDAPRVHHRLFEHCRSIQSLLVAASTSKGLPPSSHQPAAAPLATPKKRSSTLEGFLLPAPVPAPVTPISPLALKAINPATQPLQWTVSNRGSSFQARTME